MSLSIVGALHSFIECTRMCTRISTPKYFSTVLGYVFKYVHMYLSSQVYMIYIHESHRGPSHRRSGESAQTDIFYSMFPSHLVWPFVHGSEPKLDVKRLNGVQLANTCDFQGSFGIDALYIQLDS